VILILCIDDGLQHGPNRWVGSELELATGIALDSCGSQRCGSQTLQLADIIRVNLDNLIFEQKQKQNPTHS
jgi:hypothetical protein